MSRLEHGQRSTSPERRPLRGAPFLEGNHRAERPADEEEDIDATLRLLDTTKNQNSARKRVVGLRRPTAQVQHDGRTTSEDEVSSSSTGTGDDGRRSSSISRRSSFTDHSRLNKIEDMTDEALVQRITRALDGENDPDEDTRPRDGDLHPSQLQEVSDYNNQQRSAPFVVASTAAPARPFSQLTFAERLRARVLGEQSIHRPLWSGEDRLVHEDLLPARRSCRLPPHITPLQKLLLRMWLFFARWKPTINALDRGCAICLFLWLELYVLHCYWVLTPLTMVSTLLILGWARAATTQRLWVLRHSLWHLYCVSIILILLERCYQAELGGPCTNAGFLKYLGADGIPLASGGTDGVRKAAGRPRNPLEDLPLSMVPANDKAVLLQEKKMWTEPTTAPFLKHGWAGTRWLNGVSIHECVLDSLTFSRPACLFDGSRNCAWVRQDAAKCVAMFFLPGILLLGVVMAGVGFGGNGGKKLCGPDKNV